MVIGKNTTGKQIIYIRVWCKSSTKYAFLPTNIRIDVKYWDTKRNALRTKARGLINPIKKQKLIDDAKGRASDLIETLIGEHVPVTFPGNSAAMK